MSNATTRRALLRAAASLGVAAAVAGLPAATARRPRAEGLSAIAWQLQDGDLVFRAGASAPSLAVRSASSGASITHVGIATLGHAGPLIVHAAPAEHGRPSGVSGLTWAQYAQADDVEEVAVFRLGGLTPQERTRLAAVARGFLGRAFNAAFSLDDTGPLYCTQVALASCAAVDRTIYDWVKPTPVALMSDPVYLPVSLLNWPRLVEIARA